MKTKDSHSSPINKDIEHYGRVLLAELYAAMLAAGHIETDGKDEDQILEEIRKYAVRWSKRRPMVMATDFRPSLLRQARLYKRRKQHNDAILYYATWFEHWINGFLDRKIHTLEANEIRHLLRDVSLRGKFTWLLVLVSGHRISVKQLHTIFRVADLRNEFVHYKFKLVDVDKDEDEDLERAGRLAEAAARYLHDFETRHLFKGAARDLLKRFRHTKREVQTAKQTQPNQN